MSPRAHLGLRLSGLLLLLVMSVWPRSRSEHPDRTVGPVATPAHFAVTTAARLDGDREPRPRAARVAMSVAESEEDEASVGDTPQTN
jgi:hypothetical protein